MRKTLSDSISEYNDGKLNLGTTGRPQIYLHDIKSALLKLYREVGLNASTQILDHFKIETVDKLPESQYELFLCMCENFGK